MSAPVLTITLNPAIDQTIEVARLSPGEVHRAGSVRFDPGGKGVNVASCLADWGQDCVVAGWLGRDNVASFEALMAHPRLADAMVRIAGQTRTNIKLLDASRSETTDINLPGFATDAAEFDLLCSALNRHFSPSRIVVMAGSLPAGTPPHAWSQLLAAATADGSRVLVDTSGAPLAELLRPQARVLPAAIKPNRAELSAYAGRTLQGRADVLGVARELVERGIGLVVVSMGGDGALFVQAGRALQVRPPPTKLGSSVGAGDAMVAGIVSGWVDDLGLEALARRATAFAVGKLRLQGAHVPSRDHIDAYAAACAVDEI